MVASFCFQPAASRQAEIGFWRATEHRNFALVSRYVASSANYEILSRTCWLVWMLTARRSDSRRITTHVDLVARCQNGEKIHRIDFLVPSLFRMLLSYCLANISIFSILFYINLKQKIHVHYKSLEILIEQIFLNTISLYKIYESDK